MKSGQPHPVVSPLVKSYPQIPDRVAGWLQEYPQCIHTRRVTVSFKILHVDWAFSVHYWTSVNSLYHIFEKYTNHGRHHWLGTGSSQNVCNWNVKSDLNELTRLRAFLVIHGGRLATSSDHIYTKVILQCPVNRRPLVPVVNPCHPEFFLRAATWLVTRKMAFIVSVKSCQHWWYKCMAP